MQHIFGDIMKINAIHTKIYKPEILTCPKCRKNLKWEPRYQNVIRNIFIDVQTIKKLRLDRNLGKDEDEDDTYFCKAKKIIDKICKETFRQTQKTDILVNNNNLISQKINIFEILPKKSIFSNESQFEYEKSNLEEKLPISFNLCMKEFQNDKNINLKKISTYNLSTLLDKFIGIEYYAYLIKSKKIKKQHKFMKNFEVVSKYFKNFDEQFNTLFFNSSDLTIKSVKGVFSSK